MTKPCLGFVANPQRNELVQAVRHATERAAQRGFRCSVTEELDGVLALPNFAEIEPDILFAFGGDGTILRAASEAVRRDIPLCGVNLGRIGFLSDVGLDEFDEVLDALLANAYSIDPCMMLQCNVNEKQQYTCINDVLLYKESFSGVVKVSVAIDDTDAGDVFCDGVIVSTPTGATGYAISAGGPVVAPGLEAAVITPICPHSLAFRPIITPATSRIQMLVDGNTHLAIDGVHVCEVLPTDVVTITRGERMVKFVRVRKRNLYALIHDKLA
ncbi:MAG: NAD(+)/NADH kinase [Clostridia bacterium]|nr:NAD(+)/NADH kinase [Clostridia bacterium]